MKKSAFILLLLLSGSLGLMAFRHNFYVSICQVEYNKSTKSIEVSHRIFLDDFEKGLEALGTGRLNLGTENESKKADAYVLRYLMKHFKLKVDGQEARWNFVGKEYENDVVWIYVEAPDVSPFKNITVENTVLTEIYDAQTNMVHVKVGDVKKSLLLNAGTKEGTLEFGE